MGCGHAEVLAESLQFGNGLWIYEIVQRLLCFCMLQSQSQSQGMAWGPSVLGQLS